jgi:hypothetical protein
MSDKDKYPDRKPERKNVLELPLDLTDKYRKIHSMTAEYTFF